MNDAQASILLNQNSKIYLGAESPSSTDARLWTQPENIPEWGATHSKVRFDLYIAAVGGAPTTWTLGVKFQKFLVHTSGVNFQFPLWVDLDATEVASDIVEGVPWSSTLRTGDTGSVPLAGGYGVVATNVTTLPLRISRTLSNFGLACRIIMDPQSTGGTTPYLNIAAIATRMNG